MRHFRWISIGMVASGLIVAALAVVLPLDPFWALGGIMLSVSGVIKLVMLHLWRELGRPGQAASTVAPRKR